MTTTYPKRLIEVDLPIKRISAHARREKSIRHGHISTLHIWWARRPLAACRAVICASLWPDPVDELCPQVFREKAAELIKAFAKKAAYMGKTCSDESYGRWQGLVKGRIELDADNPKHWNVLRYSLLDFIADFANWDNSTQEDYLETSRALTQAAHEALGGEPGTRPLVVDPFAGGGSIPLEALRVGADPFASDLNPVAVLLNKVVLEYIPKYGQRLADELRKWGEWIKEEAEKELAEFYPKDPDGSTPIAYLWARTITCEGPGCGAEVPMLKSLWLSKGGKQSSALKLVPSFEEKQVDIQLVENAIIKEVGEGTIRRGAVTCPCCGFTTPVSSVREQLKKRRGGAADSRLTCIVVSSSKGQEKVYRLPSKNDFGAIDKAETELSNRKKKHPSKISLIPEEEISFNEIRRISVPLYGMTTWGDIFTPRQLLTITTISRLVEEVYQEVAVQDVSLAKAVSTCLALAIGRGIDYWSSLARWAGNFIGNTFGRQAIPFVSDFAEVAPFCNRSGNWIGAIDWISRFIERESKISFVELGQVVQASAASHPLPDDFCQALVTDPPYYDSVPYAYLSDYFYVWLRRSIGSLYPSLFVSESVPKEEEIVVDRPHELSTSTKDIGFYERQLKESFAQGRRILAPSGIGLVVFANKNTSSWEAILQAMVSSGLVLTASWPIDTERQGRVSAIDQARLQSSIHLFCRPRENPDGSLKEEVGDWRDVLQELPQRIHEWMPRLASEGVVGADAIFACLGPALEIFSRYSSVEKANGEEITLREYLEYVWGAVSKEALGMIFDDADTTGFEEDARLTAMWLWTLSTGESKSSIQEAEEETGKVAKSTGYTLEFDAARKIAQGLGAHLDKLTNLVEIKGDKARLLPVSERGVILFGKADLNAPTGRKKKKQDKQLDIFTVLDEGEQGDSGQWSDPGVPQVGKTVLDQVHQSMILFAAGRSDALKRFLVEDGIGNDQRYWKLAQALSALYPMGTDEKRWVDGVLARKKGLGF